MYQKRIAKIISMGMICSIFLFGCDKKTSFSIEPFNSNEMLQKVVNESIVDRFAENLCIVTEEDEQKEDDTMTASSSLIFDVTEQKILFADNVYEKLYPASVTKIVTALVVLKYGNLEDIVTVSYNASHITEYGAKLCGFQENDKIRLKDLLYSFLIYSGNDAGIAIAEHMSGSVEAFAELMNEEVRKLGATNSNFVNPHGLHDDNHYTTAYDVYLVFNELLHYPLFVDIINQAAYEAEYIKADGTQTAVTFTNTNRYLLGTEIPPEGITVIGGKTGTTSKAGSCLVLLSQDEQATQYISIVFKAETGDDLFHQMTHLLGYIS